MNMKNKIQFAYCLDMARNHKAWISADGLDSVAPPVLTINHGPGSAARTLADVRQFWGADLFDDVIRTARREKQTTVRMMALCAQFGITGYGCELVIEYIGRLKLSNNVTGARPEYYATRYNYGKALQFLISDAEESAKTALMNAFAV